MCKSIYMQKLTQLLNGFTNIVKLETQEIWLSKKNVLILINTEYFEYQIDAFNVYPAPSIGCKQYHSIVKNFTEMQGLL